jgi:biopolymer transport protein ExbB
MVMATLLMGVVLAVGVQGARGQAAAGGGNAAGAAAGAAAASQPVTATVGERLQGAWGNLKYMHTAGGSCMYGIDVLLLLGVALLLERLVRLRRRSVLPLALWKSVSERWEQGDIKGVRDVCAGRRKSTLSKVITYLIDSEDDTPDEREAMVNEVASRDIDVHRMMCYPLAAIASLAPLLGLLGTVVGIRECFRDIALAGEMGKPSMLAGGIEKALITTIYGLVVAIPILFAYNLFKFRINLLATELEEVVSSILGHYHKIGKK